MSHIVAPGPLADQLLAMVGREDRSGLKLDEPVSLTIADRRIYQRGLALPIGDDGVVIGVDAGMKPAAGNATTFANAP